MKTQTQPRAAGEAAPYRWAYHPITSDRIALLGPDGKDAMLATDDGEHVVLRFQSELHADHLLLAINSHARLVAENKALREALAKTRPYVELYAQNNPNAISPADTLKQIDAALALAKDGKE